MTTAGASEELVVLLDDDGNAIGTAPKATVHTSDTPLHRAFSCYVFDGAGRLLVTQRAAVKRTFPGVWTNTVCGHPAPGEDDVDAITRRARDELGLAVVDVVVALPRFRYRAEAGGLVENEICPVYLARTAGEPAPDPAEVDDHRWTTWVDFLGEVTTDAAGDVWSPWCRLQAPQLDATGAVDRYLG